MGLFDRKKKIPNIDITSKGMFRYRPKKSKPPKPPKHAKQASGRRAGVRSAATKTVEPLPATEERELFARNAQFRLKRASAEEIGKLPSMFGDVAGRADQRGYSILQTFQDTLGEPGYRTDSQQRLFVRVQAAAKAQQDRERHLREKEEISALIARGDPLLQGEIQHVSSSNVNAFQYYGDSYELIIEYHDGSFYLYEGVSHEEARTLLYAGSKGGWVWDNLRVRGTVFGYKKVYMLISGFGKPRLWMKTEESRLRHGAIPPEGESFKGFHPLFNPGGSYNPMDPNA